MTCATPHCSPIPGSAGSRDYPCGMFSEFRQTSLMSPELNRFIRGMRAEAEALAIEGNTKNGFRRHGSDVQYVKKSGPDHTNPIRAGHAIGASEA